jgi:hypothetical protein
MNEADDPPPYVTWLKNAGFSEHSNEPWSGVTSCETVSSARSLLHGVTCLVLIFVIVEVGTVELHLSRVIGTASHPNMQ